MRQPRIIATHSYRGGTGKSNVTANIATEFARYGLRVGIVDTDLPSPGIHILFGHDQPLKTVNGVLQKSYPLSEAILDVTPESLQNTGSILLLPGSPKPGDIAQIVRESYSMEAMVDVYRDFIKSAGLDLLLIDTHPGLNEPTLYSITVADLLIMVLRPDRQDYQGTAVAVDVARKLGVPAISLLVNKALTSSDWHQLKTTIEGTYGEQCLGILPQSDDIIRYGGTGLFCLQEPNHPLARGLQIVAAAILEVLDIKPESTESES
jgi:MinD-like ATPase involved in chromosome partitioning or flagellar assembly